MKLHEAAEMALGVAHSMYPHCDTLLLAGSVRRKKPEVKDIEFVIVPKPYQSGLFQDGLAAVVNQWKKVKGEMEYGKVKYTQRILKEGVKLDLFFATPENLGYIYMLRTGSSEWNQKFMLPRLKGNGYRAHAGNIWWKGEIYPVPSEEDMFRIMGLGLGAVKPENRI